MKPVDPHSETIVGAITLGSDLQMAAQNEEACLEMGELLQDVFRVERFVASGGMGQVFRARDLRLERPVAVKVLHGRFLESDSGLKRFQREARSLSRVVHPNVVATYEVGVHQQSPFLVMEFVDGPTLGTYIRSKGRLKLDEAVKLTTQIAAGLDEAHALGIVHRDVKPGNILLHRLRSGGLLAKVVDFGLALGAEGGEGGARGDVTTGKHEILGSPLYMSPEQIEGGELTGASDQYSLGIVLFEMLTGSPPFLGSSLNAIFQKHLTAEPQSLQELCTWEHAEKVWEVIQRVLSKKPSERYSSVSEFMTALRQASGVKDDESTHSSACDVCETLVKQGDGFCRGCGSSVPMKACGVCGAERRGKRYHCIQCSASLLVRPVRRERSREDRPEGLEWSPDTISTLGVVVALEAISSNGLIPNWEWMADQFCTSVERENGRPLVVLDGEALAVFGLGGLREREVERAVDAALFVLGQVDRDLETRGLRDEVQVRISVELGEIDAKGAGMSWGTARITGSGIQAARQLNRLVRTPGVFVGRNAWREVRSLYESDREGKALRVLSRRRVAILREASRVGGQAVPLIGRDYEIEHLERAFSRMTQRGRLVVVPVIGAPGSGKSRLTSEFLSRLNKRSETCTVDVSQCIPSSEGVPFAPFRRSFRNRYPIYDGDEKATVYALLRHLPGVRALPDDVAESRVERLSALLGLAGNSGSHEASEEAWQSPSDPSQELAFEAYCHYIRALSKEIPYILVVDDFQWIRPSSMKLLSYLSQRCLDCPIMIIMTVRERDADKTLASVDVPASSLTALELGMLTKRDVHAMAESLFGPAVLDEKLLRTLHELTNGLPQEVEEHLEALVESGSLKKDGTEWSYEAVGEAESSAMPTSLRELVHQRLARLGQEEQRILRAGALAGQTFSIALLSAMVERPVDDLEIDELVQEGWLMESDAGDFPRSREVSFRQDRVRDVVLELLTEEGSRSLHMKAAAWLDSLSGEVQPSARTARLARHYGEAGAHREAARYTLERAREFGLAFAGTEAFDAFGDAMELGMQLKEHHTVDTETDSLLMEALSGRSKWGWILGEHEEARKAIYNSELCFTRPDHKDFWLMQDLVYGEILSIEGAYQEAVERFEVAIATALQLQKKDLAALIQGRIAFGLANLGRIDEAIDEANALLADSEIQKTEAWYRGAGSACGVLARIALKKKQYMDSRKLNRQASEYRSLAGDSVGTLLAQIAEGNVCFFAGDYENALAIYERTARELSDLGYLHGASQANVNKAETLLMKNMPADALETLKECEESFRMLSASPDLVELLRIRAESLLDLDRPSDAISVIDEALRIARDENVLNVEGSLQDLKTRASSAYQKTQS